MLASLRGDGRPSFLPEQPTETKQTSRSSIPAEIRVCVFVCVVVVFVILVWNLVTAVVSP